jgi:hypothetical protein
MEQKLKLKYTSLSFVVAALVLAGCSGSAPDPIVPTSPTPAGGDALKVRPPTPLSPSDGGLLESRRPTLVVDNPAATFAPAATLRLRFVVYDEAGRLVHASAPVALGEATTSYALPIELDHAHTYRWFAEVVWGDSTGPATAARSFSTPGAPVAAQASGPCPGTSPLAIVECQRERRPGFMDDDQLLELMGAIAANLNQNGVPGGPFGVLRKASGNNCHGYSCDIICAGHGGGQRQYDVLRDLEGPQVPVWHGPHGGDDIRVDVCEIR